VVSVVIDTAHHWSAVSLSPPSSGQHSEVSLTPLTTKIGDFKVEFQGKYEFKFKKALTPGSVS
jgi:hypothetical protein